MEDNLSESDIADDTRVDNTSFVLEHALNSAIIMFSYTMTITAKDAIQMIIKCLQKKLIGKSFIACGSVKQSRVMGGFPAQLSHNIVKTVIEEQKREEKKELDEFMRGDNVVADTMRRASQSSKHPTSTTTNLKKSVSGDSEHIQSNIRHTFGPQGDDNKSTELMLLRETFGSCDYNEYQEYLALAKDEPLVITSKSAFKNIKFFSPSIGIHERLHGGSELDDLEIQEGGRMEDMATRILNDYKPPSTTPIPDYVVDVLHKELIQFRTKAEVSALKKAGVIKGKEANDYQRSENVMYFRDGLNGRPDLLLLSSTGTPIGVVEVKCSKKKKPDSEYSTAIKQLALYHIMLKTKECFLLVYPKGKGRFDPRLIRPTASQIQSACASISSIKKNQAKFAEVAFNYFKRR